MKYSYLKIRAKNYLVGSLAGLFIASAIPYAVIFSLSALNYYFYLFLKNSDLSFLPFLTDYATAVRPVLLTVSLTVGALIYQLSRLYSDACFLEKSRSGKLSFKRAARQLSLKKLLSYTVSQLIRFFLSVAWTAFYFFPAAVTLGTFVYALRSGEYPPKAVAALGAATAILAGIGWIFLSVTLKRYSFAGLAILEERQKESVKAIEESIKIMEGKSPRYQGLLASFTGWKILSALVIPAVYVMPYMEMAKICFYNSASGFVYSKQRSEKPIIFYVNSYQGLTEKNGLKPNI